MIQYIMKRHIYRNITGIYNLVEKPQSAQFSSGKEVRQNNEMKRGISKSTSLNMQSTIEKLSTQYIGRPMPDVNTIKPSNNTILNLLNISGKDIADELELNMKVGIGKAKNAKNIGQVAASIIEKGQNTKNSQQLFVQSTDATQKEKNQKMLQQLQILENINNKVVTDRQLKTKKGNINPSSSNQKLVKRFQKELPRNMLIQNSRKFLQIAINIMPYEYLHKMVNQIQTFVNRFQKNQQSIAELRTKSYLKPQSKKILEKLRNKQQNFFQNIKHFLDNLSLQDSTVSEMLSLLSRSDPSIIRSQNIEKMIYLHEQGTMEQTDKESKAFLSLILNDIIDDQNEQEVRVDSRKSEIATTKKSTPQNLLLQQQNDVKFPQFNPFKQQPRLFTKKRKVSYLQKERFEVTEQSLKYVKEFLLSNKSIVQDQIIFKKANHSKTNLFSKQKQRHTPTTTSTTKSHVATANFTKLKEPINKWVYAYDLPYSLTKQRCDDLVGYISEKYGQVTDRFIYSYKDMLQMRNYIRMYSQEKKQKQLEQYDPIARVSSTDKLVEKLQSNKNLKLHKSSMVLKFKNISAKKAILDKEMRLYGMNYKEFKCVRFQEAASKNILVLTMIPWGCSTYQLLQSINKILKPALDLQVTYPNCTLSKSYVFIEFDTFQEAIQSTNLLNNMKFQVIFQIYFTQGLTLKAQISYGSSKKYGGVYKGALELDYYKNLTSKLRDLNCYFNEQVYK